MGLSKHGLIALRGEQRSLPWGGVGSAGGREQARVCLAYLAHTGGDTWPAHPADQPLLGTWWPCCPVLGSLLV